MDKIEEEVVEAIKAVEGLEIKVIANHLVFTREMMIFKKTEETIITSPRLSVIDVETLVTTSMSAT